MPAGGLPYSLSDLARRDPGQYTQMPVADRLGMLQNGMQGQQLGQEDMALLQLLRQRREQEGMNAQGQPAPETSPPGLLARLLSQLQQSNPFNVVGGSLGQGPRG
jgi:hypothetical protein